MHKIPLPPFTSGRGIFYSYDSYMNRTQQQTTGVEPSLTLYRYDDANRLLLTMKTCKETREAVFYQYDAAGNQIETSTITSKTPLTAGEYEAAALTAQTFADKSMDALSFDLEAKEILQSGIVGRHRTTKWQKREYNGLNQLATVGEQGLKVVYWYRPDGLRHSKTVNDKTTIHHWDLGCSPQGNRRGLPRHQTSEGLRIWCWKPPAPAKLRAATCVGWNCFANPLGYSVFITCLMSVET